MSLSLLVHALLLWAEPVRAPWGAAGERGMRIKARLVAVAAEPPETMPAMLPAPDGVPVAAAQRPSAEPVSPAPEEQTAARSDAPPAPSSPELEPGAAATADAAAAPPPSEAAGAIQVPLPGPPEFLPVRMLDVLPQPDQPVALAYPDEVGMGRSGVVALLLFIDELGVVVEAKVVDSNPPGVFDDYAIEVFRATRFVPGQRGGRPVRSRLVVEMSFDAGAASRRAQ